MHTKVMQGSLSQMSKSMHTMHTNLPKVIRLVSSRARTQCSWFGSVRVLNSYTLQTQFVRFRQSFQNREGEKLMEEIQFKEGSNFKEKIRTKQSLSYFLIASFSDSKILFALLTYLGLLFCFFQIFFVDW